MKRLKLKGSKMKKRSKRDSKRKRSVKPLKMQRIRNSRQLEASQTLSHLSQISVDLEGKLRKETDLKAVKKCLRSCIILAARAQQAWDPWAANPSHS